MSAPVCEVCLKQVYKLNLKYETVLVNVCMSCLANNFHVCEIDEIAVKKAKIDSLIKFVGVNYGNAFFFDSLIELLKNLKEGEK